MILTNSLKSQEFQVELAIVMKNGTNNLHDKYNGMNLTPVHSMIKFMLHSVNEYDGMKH